MSDLLWYEASLNSTRTFIMLQHTLNMTLLNFSSSSGKPRELSISATWAYWSMEEGENVFLAAQANSLLNL